MSSITGAKGEPRWVTGEAPSLAATFTELSEFALKRGNLLKGTTVERNAFTAAGYAEEGVYWHDTTLDELAHYTGSVWRVWPKIASGRALLSSTISTISFPSGLFTSLPRVSTQIVSASGSAIGVTVLVTAVTEASFTARLESGGPFPVDWTAIQAD